jgi:ribosomal protein L37AE/L43A
MRRTVNPPCPKCKKRSFTRSVKEEGILWFCYLCKHSRFIEKNIKVKEEGK